MDNPDVRRGETCTSEHFLTFSGTLCRLRSRDYQPKTTRRRFPGLGIWNHGREAALAVRAERQGARLLRGVAHRGREEAQDGGGRGDVARLRRSESERQSGASAGGQNLRERSGIRQRRIP